MCRAIHTRAYVPVPPLPPMSASSPATAAPRLGVWDRFGIVLSALCLAHCLAVPVLLAGSAAWASEAVHLWLAVGLVPVTALAVVPGYRRHGRGEVLVLAAVGLAGLFAALLLEPVVGASGERLITAGAGILLVAGHLRNGHRHAHGHVHGRADARAAGVRAAEG